MSTKKSKSDEKPSPELQALYKEYWATKTKYGKQIMDAMDRFGVYSDQVERIQLREAKSINALYEKIKKQEEALNTTCKKIIDEFVYIQSNIIKNVFKNKENDLFRANNIGIVYQQDNLLTDFTALENVYLSSQAQ